MRYGKFLILGSLALAALLSTTSSQVEARIYGRGFGGFGRGIGIGYGRGYGGYGYNRGFGYGGYGLGGYGYRGIGLGLGGYGYGGYGLGGYGLGYGNGYYGYSSYSPTYYGYSSYYPGYSGYSSYNPGYYASGYSLSPSYSYVPNYAYSQPQNYYTDQTYPSVVTASTGTTQRSMYYNPQPTDNTARLHVIVPAGAQVWVGGEETAQTGPDRVFASPAIQPGRSYTYEVKARWMQEGAPVEQTKQVRVQANQTTTVDFSPVAEKQ
jgi:uncharacterized protein (TIGR03000 family)